MSLMPMTQDVSGLPVLQDISRQRKLADMLRTQSQQQEQGQMVSGHYIAPSITQGLAHLLQAYQSKQANDSADTQEKSYATNKALAYANAMKPNQPQPMADNSAMTQPQAMPQPQQQAPQAQSPNFNVMPQTDTPAQPQAMPMQAQAQPVQPEQDQRSRLIQLGAQYPELESSIRMQLDDLNHTRGIDEAKTLQAGNWAHEDLNHVRNLAETRADTQSGYENAATVNAGNHAFTTSERVAGQGFTVGQNNANHAFELKQEGIKQAAENLRAGISPDGKPSADIETTAKAIARGQLPPPSGMALTNPKNQRILARVMDINPDYDYTQVTAKKKAASDFTSGALGTQMRSFATAGNHLDQLSKLSDALDNGNIQLINKVTQEYSKQTGQVAPTNFDAAKGIVAKEVMKAIVSGGGGVSEREELDRLMSKAQSPAQLKGVISQYRNLMGSQYDNLLAQRRAAGLSDSTLPKYNITETPEAHPQDSLAINWAKLNPNDPRSKAILKANGL